MYVRTNKNAPQYKLCSFDLADEKVILTDVISHEDRALLKTTRPLPDGKLAVVYSRDVRGCSLVGFIYQ